MIFHIIGITGTFEGYIAGPADLYNKGNNAKGFYSVGGGALELQTDKMVLTNVTSTGKSTCRVCSGSPINTTGYSKVNIHIVDVQGSSGFGCYLKSQKGDDVGTTYAQASFNGISAGQTLSFSFSDSVNAYLYMRGPNVSSSTQKFYIDRIWLS